MKISNEKKLENREAIIQAAVDLVIEKGYKAATMRAIARKAGLGDATIYNYFPTKESILYSYYEEKFAEAGESLGGIDGFDEFNFQERMQELFETCLETFLADREFVQETFELVFYPVAPHKDLKRIKSNFMVSLDAIFDAAVEAGEIEEPRFRELTDHFFWDYFVGVTFYWLKDTSEHFSDTTELIDMTMSLACAVLKAGVVNKLFDIASFLFRNHIVSRLQTIHSGLDAFSQIRREFMGEVNERPDTGKQD
jgi:AcrR family transcriptional regulator